MTEQATQLTLNRPLIERLVDHVSKNQYEFDMGSFWGFNGNATSQFGTMLIADVKRLAQNGCMTTGCLFGTAMMLAPEYTEYDEHMALPTRSVADEWCIRTVPSATVIGEKLFGLPRDVLEHLFFSQNWPVEYSNQSDVAEWTSAILILDRILEEGNGDFLLEGPTHQQVEDDNWHEEDDDDDDTWWDDDDGDDDDQDWDNEGLDTDKEYW